MKIFPMCSSEISQQFLEMGQPNYFQYLHDFLGVPSAFQFALQSVQIILLGVQVGLYGSTSLAPATGVGGPFDL